MRNARRDSLDMLKDLKKDGELTEDEFASSEKEIQKILDNWTDKIDSLTQDKEKEIMEV